MKAAGFALAGAVAIGALLSPALAQQTLSGIVTKIDRLNGTIAIRQVQDGTVGSSDSGTAQEFKVPDAKQLETFHAGDRVDFSVAEGNGDVKTISTLKKP